MIKTLDIGRNICYYIYVRGNTISYDEALKLYGFDGLADDIWNNENYTSQVLNYIKKYELEVE